MARGFIQGYVERGGENVSTDGRVSTTEVQRSFPLATVTVFNAGTVVLATIFSTELGAPLANPFVADTDGHWGFWADQARYDVQFSGGGISSPYTVFNLETIIAAGLVDPGSNGFLARTAPGVLAARTFLGTTSAIIVTNGDGSGNPVINLDVGLDFSGKTISGGTFIAPSIANFSNAIHSHADVVGGGQLNATNVFSAGTVPVARLPIMVGASGVANGTSGLVPQPLIGDQGNFLRGDGVWATAGGGGGGTPGGANTTVQYNNAGAFGGISGATSNGTNITFSSANLIATRPRFITSIDDTNGNEVIGLISTGSAVNEISITNAGAGSHPTISSTGGDSNPNININPKGSGIIATTGNIQISNNAPQMAFIDVNDSKTVRISLSGANWAFINDTLGSTPVNINTTSNLVSFAGNLLVNGGSLDLSSISATVLNFIDTNAPKQMQIILDESVSSWRFINATASFEVFAADTTTHVVRFGAIPTLPASNPTTANQAVRKQYVDDNTFWSANFFIADPSTFPLNSFDLSQKAFIPADGIPAGRRWRATRAALIWSSGSESGSFVVTIRSHPVSDQTSQTTLATFTIDTEDIGVGVEIDIGDVTYTVDSYVFVILDSRSSPLQRAVSISLVGDKLG